jgi:hypothetical protein
VGDRLGRAVPDPDDPPEVDEEDAVADRLEHARRLGSLLGLPVELCVLDRGTCASGELLGECKVLVPVASARLGCDERDHADRPAAREEWHAHVALKTELAHQLEVEVVDRELGQGLFGDFRRQLALAGAEDEGRALPSFGRLRISPRELQRELDLLRIDVLDRERAEPVVLEDVDACPVGDPRDGKLRKGGQRAAVVEGAAEHRPRLDEKPLRFLRTLAVVDVGVGPEPLHDLAASTPHRHRPRQVPAVRAVVRVAEADLVLVRLSSVECALPELQRPRQIVGMHHLRPPGLHALDERRAEIVERALVHVVDLAVRQRRPDLVGLRLCQEAVTLLALTSEL